MMRRVGFVSNSSSSSFVIKKKDLTSIQIQKIIDYYEENNLSEEEKFFIANASKCSSWTERLKNETKHIPPS